MFTPKLYYIPPNYLSKESIFSRMLELADKHGMTVICYFAGRKMEIKPEPKKLKKHSGISVKYIKPTVSKQNGHEVISLEINGHFFNFRGHYVFGILVDESAKKIKIPGKPISTPPQIIKE